MIIVVGTTTSEDDALCIYCIIHVCGVGVSVCMYVCSCFCVIHEARNPKMQPNHRIKYTTHIQTLYYFDTMLGNLGKLKYS